MQGVTTQVYWLNIITACTTDLKKKKDIRSSKPSLLRTIILFNTALTREKFLTTARHSSSATDITCPRYWKEVTISRGFP